MTDYREILRLKSLGINNSRISSGMGISRQTVVTALHRAGNLGIGHKEAAEMSDRELAAALYPPGSGKPAYKMPDCAQIHREMAKSGVTLQLLWFEYCDHCRDAGETPYQLTQFKKLYRDFVVRSKATMHIERKPGEIMEVDWAGQTAGVASTDTGEIMDAHVFVAVLPYSGYAYAEAFFGQGQEEWIAAHVNMYAFFGGVTRILVPDNLKTGVIKHTKSETVLNRSYREMAEHYGTAVIPTRVRRPKDKSSVEGAVGNISNFILAAVRNQRFLSLPELNAVIRERLFLFNNKPFQKKEGSRALLFEEEKEYLMPLPVSAFEFATWKVATVQYNYHVSVDGQNYSVPYSYIKRKVDVRSARNTVEIFCDGERVCSHAKLCGRSGQYSTQESHMPQSHRQYAKWDGNRFRKWAAKIGANTAETVESMLSAHKVEQQGYRSCMALLKLSDRFTPERLEAACGVALTYTRNPSYKTVQSVLGSGRDKVDTESAPRPPASGFTRGAGYYGRGRE
jgi:transposase